MTRFQKEVSGALGDFWRKHAIEESAKAVRKALGDAVVEDDGAIRWKESGHYLMDDMTEMLEYAGYPFSREATRAKREKQDRVTIAEMQKRMAEEEYDFEAMAEMRNVFGEGAVVVNIITGEKVRL